MRTLTFLGTGTSTGVPMLGCWCAVCTSADPRNHRYRASVAIECDGGPILIDTTPELRLQLLRAKLPVARAVLYTHYHADHLFGLDDLRQFPRQLQGSVPIYCTDDVEAVIRRTFAYIFPDSDAYSPAMYVPKLEFHRIEPGQPFDVLGQRIVPVALEHAQFRVMGFRIGDLAYCTDVNRIPDASLELLTGLEVLILDALRFTPHPAHLSLSEALEYVERLKPKRAIFTHLSHEFDHETISGQLPAGVELAYDGLRVPF